jgi:hypothetical protein
MCRKLPLDLVYHTSALKVCFKPSLRIKLSGLAIVGFNEPLIKGMKDTKHQGTLLKKPHGGMTSVPSLISCSGESPPRYTGEMKQLFKYLKQY